MEKTRRTNSTSGRTDDVTGVDQREVSGNGILRIAEAKRPERTVTTDQGEIEAHLRDFFMAKFQETDPSELGQMTGHIRQVCQNLRRLDEGETADLRSEATLEELPADDPVEPAEQSAGHADEASSRYQPAAPVEHDHGETSAFGTQDEVADSLGPESAWLMAEVTMELRELSRGPATEEQWARFQPILDRAEAAITEHLRLPSRGSRQTPPRCEINPENASLTQGLYKSNRRRAVRLIVEGPPQLCPIDPGTLHGYFSHLCPPCPWTLPFYGQEPSPTRSSTRAPLYQRKSQQSSGELENFEDYVIYKKGAGEDPTNWRPIALGRTIAKLYAGCLTNRLQRWFGVHAVLSRCQKGFLPYDDVFEHNFVLQGRLDDARPEGGELCVRFLDYANAFGSVAHQAVVDAVGGAGAGEAFTAIVEELYRANTTCVVAAAGTTEPINIGAGLWQGCPLSGLLFNLVVDPVIRAVQGGARQHNILAYADDLTLLAEHPATLQCRLNVVTVLSDRLGLRLKPAKCRTLHLSGRHPVGTRPTTFTVGGRPGPGTGGLRGAPVPGATCGVQALSFAMRVGLASKGEWHRLDEELHPLIKKTLDVPARTSNEYVYGSAHAGTAGIPLAAELSDICRVDGAFKLLSSTDPEVRERAREELDRVVSRRLRRPAETEDTEAYLSGDFRQTAPQLQSVWTEARKASRRLSVAWELYDQGARITCGEATVSAGNRDKVIKILRAILNQGRDRSLQDKLF
ncbi:hypothetical protein MTO96_029515 [Rhipicephalus appendiculatus]